MSNKIIPRTKRKNVEIILLKGAVKRALKMFECKGVHQPIFNIKFGFHTCYKCGKYIGEINNSEIQ